MTTAPWRSAAASPSGTVSRRTPSSRSKAADSLATSGSSLATRAERAGHPHRAADLRSREEPLAADVERDPGGPERGLDGGELGVRSDEDRHRAVCGPGPRERPDRVGHPGQLGLVGREAADLRLGPGRQARDEAFRRPRRDSGTSLVGCHPAGGEDPVGQREDLGRRAVVGLQPDDPRARVALGEADQVVARGAGERVDRLVLVADDRQVLAAAEPRVEERGLERVGVLVFVDREPAVAVADLGRDRWRRASISPIVSSSMSSKSIRPARALAVSYRR